MSEITADFFLKNGDIELMKKVAKELVKAEFITFLKQNLIHYKQH